MAKIEKARYWTAVLYPENMPQDWEDKLPDTVQLPFAYCKHTRDRDSKSEHRKDHVHLILAFPNTTTYQHAMGVFDLLSKAGKRAVNTCQAVINIRHMYDYLIHDTEKCRQQQKEQYAPSERITGNNFDIGSYEQIGAAEKDEIYRELSGIIREQGFTNYADFTDFVWDKLEDSHYLEIYRTYSANFERLIRGNYHRWERDNGFSPSQGQQHPSNTPTTQKNIEFCCPDCGSVNIKKAGKTKSQSQRWACKDCGKTFVF